MSRLWLVIRFVFLGACLVTFAACSASSGKHTSGDLSSSVPRVVQSGAASTAVAAKTETVSPVAGNSTATVSSSPAKLSPDVEHLSRVLSSMSARAKAVIPDGNPEEFLADLHKVLEAEKHFRQDDLSLYYLIDKKHAVSADYVPKDLVPLVKNDFYNISRNGLSLRPDVERALQEMAKGALQDGIKLMVSSTYRSYDYQTKLFARYVAQDGEALAERYSARAGTSQHQLGVAIDFGSITDEFAETRMGRWLAEHCEEYGWSLSFPKEYEDVTGFMWECWHFRYIGKEACAFQKKWFGDVQQFMIEFIDAWKTLQ